MAKFVNDRPQSRVETLTLYVNGNAEPISFAGKRYFLPVWIELEGDENFLTLGEKSPMEIIIEGYKLHGLLPVEQKPDTNQYLCEVEYFEIQ